MTDSEYLQRIKTCVNNGVEIYASDKLNIFNDLKFLYGLYRKQQMELGRSYRAHDELFEGLKEVREIFFGDSEAAEKLRQTCDRAFTKAERQWGE